MEETHLEKAAHFFNQMKIIDPEKEFALKHTYAATYLMYGYAKDGMTKEAVSTYSYLKEAKARYDGKFWDEEWVAIAMGALVVAYIRELPIRNNDIKKAHKLYLEMKNIGNDKVVLESCGEAACLLATAYARNGESEKAQQLYNEVQNMGVAPDDMSEEAREYFFYFLLHSGRLDEFRVFLDFSVWDERIKRAAKKRMAVKLIISYCKAGRFEEGLQLCKSLENSSDIWIGAIKPLKECYLSSMGMKKLRKAAGQGDADAQHSLGCSYEKGYGVERDAAQAVKWWRRAAEQGSPGASFALGKALYFGLGVRKNRKKAVAFLQAAAQSLEEAARFLRENGLVRQCGETLPL
jgi:pentatricopeptide repeat protein